MKKYLWATVLGFCSIATLGAANFFDVNVSPYIIECFDKDEINSQEKAIIEKASLNILSMIKNQQANQLWEISHPELKRQLTSAQIAQGITQFLLGDTTSATISDERLIKIQGSEKTPVNVFCGSVKPNDPSHLSVQALVGNTNIAIVQIELPKKPFNQLVSLQLAKHKGEYRLVYMDLNSYQYNEKDSFYYKDLAKKYLDEKKHVEAFIYNQVALLLSNKGSFLQSALNMQLSADLQKLQNNQILKHALGSWQINKNQYRIISLGLITTQSDMNIHIKYVATQGLQPEQVQQDAEHLMGYLKQTYPALNQEFHGVVFEAYEKMPVDKTKIYPFYRVPMMF